MKIDRAKRWIIFKNSLLIGSNFLIEDHPSKLLLRETNFLPSIRLKLTDWGPTFRSLKIDTGIKFTRFFFLLLPKKNLQTLLMIKRTSVLLAFTKIITIFDIFTYQFLSWYPKSILLKYALCIFFFSILIKITLKKKALLDFCRSK